MTASLGSTLWFTYWGVIWPLQGHGTFVDIIKTYPQNYIGMPIGFFLAVAFALIIRNVRSEGANQQKPTSATTWPETGKKGVTITDATPFLMLLLGLVSLFESFLFGSYILAFIGLGLTFWGALFLYLKPSKYVRLELLTASSSSSLINMERMLANAGSDLKGIYLPPKRLEDYTSSLLFVPATANQPLPTTASTNPAASGSQNPLGLFITPPGLALSKLFEKHLGKSFTETKLENLQTLLPKLFEELEITKSITVNIENDTVTIQMRKHIFEEICDETRKQEKTHQTAGCPITSAIACILAKTTGKPITIENDNRTPDKTTVIKYKIMEDT